MPLLSDWLSGFLAASPVTVNQPPSFNGPVGPMGEVSPALLRTKQMINHLYIISAQQGYN